MSRLYSILLVLKNAQKYSIVLTNLILNTGYFSADRKEKSCQDLSSLSEEKDYD